MWKCKAAELLPTDLSGSFKYVNNGLGEDDNKLPYEDEDEKINGNDDGESELDDDTEFSGIDNSD